VAEETVEMFTATWSEDGVLHLSGELDLASEDDLLAAVQGWNGGRELILDLSRLSFIDSTGIRVLAAMTKETSGIVLRAPRPVVRSVLDLVGIEAWPNVSIEP
jgi:anti-anti-sigma factor